MKHNIFTVLIVILAIIVSACSNPTMSDVDTEDAEKFEKTLVLVEGQTSAFTFEDEQFTIELLGQSGGVSDVVITHKGDSRSEELTSRQAREVFGLWFMTTWSATDDGLVGLVVSNQEPPSDHSGPPIPGVVTGPGDVDDPHSHSYYEESENQDTSGSVEPYDYSYGSSPSPGDTVTVTVKLNASSSGTRLLRVALGSNSTIKEVEVPGGNSIHELQLDVPSSMSSGWQTMRFTTMTESGDIIYNSSEDYWIRIQ